MHEIILCKLGEVVLKGLNRSHFEDKLMANVARRLRPLGTFRIYTRQSTIYVEALEESCDVDGACAACQQVFGIAAVVRALPCEKTVEAIVETARTYLAEEFVVKFFDVCHDLNILDGRTIVQRYEVYILAASLRAYPSHDGHLAAILRTSKGIDDFCSFHRLVI